MVPASKRAPKMLQSCITGLTDTYNNGLDFGNCMGGFTLDVELLTLESLHQQLHLDLQL